MNYTIGHFFMIIFILFIIYFFTKKESMSVIYLDPKIATFKPVKFEPNGTYNL